MDRPGPRLKAVIDTNVVAYYLLGTEALVDEARDCLAAVALPLAPAHWEAEITNVVWMAVRANVIAPHLAPVRLGRVRRLGIESVATSTLCQGALLRSVSTGIPAYDTLFVELAVRIGCPLATFDQKLLEAFPEVATRPGSLKAS